MGSELFALTVRLAKTVMVSALLFVTVGCDVPVGAQVPGAESADATVIHTTAGSVSGRDAGSGVIAYLGIPGRGASHWTAAMAAAAAGCAMDRRPHRQRGPVARARKRGGRDPRRI